MGLKEHAEAELKKLGEDEIQIKINEQILEIIDVFGNQGHTGFTANYAINILSRLLRYLPLQPLTGEDDEWVEVGEGIEQNKRFGEVFRTNHDNKTAYWSCGRIFSNDDGKSWYSNKDSHVNIDFPYNVPDKPEFVKVQDDDKSSR